MKDKYSVHFLKLLLRQGLINFARVGTAVHCLPSMFLNSNYYCLLNKSVNFYIELLKKPSIYDMIYIDFLYPKLFVGIKRGQTNVKHKK